MILRIIQGIVAIILIALILMQSQEGLSAGLWGGESYRTKRGLEKTLVYATAFLGTVFLILSLIANFK